MKTDYLIVGSGCAGLYCALHLPMDKQITIITKKDAESSDSFLAQGGMCVMRGEDDYDSFFEDTMRAGHYENDVKSVELMIRSSQDVVKDLLMYGVEFARDENGELDYTKEGAHSNHRIVFYKDCTGREITSKLLEQVRRLPNVTLMEYTTMVDLVTDGKQCMGAVVRKEDGELEVFTAKFTVLATGGIGGVYRHSTNFRHLRGDAIALAVKHGIRLRDVNYVQIHPTTLYSANEEDKSFLISESVRGEGAKLRDKNMNRFVDELMPRDLLTKEIREQMEIDGTEHVWEDLRDIPDEELTNHFPNIVGHCMEQGYDVRRECIPVVPAQHYFMGGVWVDHESKTSMERLYAIGETACNGVHGRNRLASNSLLESLVFAKRAALDMASKRFDKEDTLLAAEAEAQCIANIDFEIYKDKKALEAEYKETVLKEIKKAEERGR